MLKPGYLEYGRTGTSHGSPYAYDTHVPFLILGPGVPEDLRSYERTCIRDIAPTLSASLASTAEWMHRPAHGGPL